MKDKTCCFTGHRNLKQYSEEKIKKALETKIKELINKGIVNFECGGALGFDTVAALTVLKMKEQYSQIKLILILPCENQTTKWQEKDKEVYEDIKSRADEVFYVSKEYHNNCMLERNRYMVDHADYIITSWNGYKHSGTYSTINYANKERKTLICLDMDNLKEVDVNPKNEDSYVFEYSFDFSKSTLKKAKNNSIDDFDKNLNKARSKSTADLMDPASKKRFSIVKNSFFCIARESNSKVQIERNMLEPHVYVKLESKALTFNTENLKCWFLDALKSSTFLNIESEYDGKFVITTKFDLLKG